MFEDRLIELLAALKSDCPFHSPRYAAHMVAEQTLPSIAGYFAGMLYNPNNVSREAAPVTEYPMDVRKSGAKLGIAIKQPLKRVQIRLAISTSRISCRENLTLADSAMCFSSTVGELR